MFYNIFSNKKEEKIGMNVIIDDREKNSLVPSELMKLSFHIEFQHLPVADYLVKDIAIERKTISDLKSSIINKRIFVQMQELKQYPSNLIIIEGNSDELFNNDVLSANAVKGFLLSAQLDFKIPLIRTKDERDTASFISLLSKRNPDKEISIRAKKLSLNKEEQIQYILEGFPNIGPKKAKRLIERFGSIRNIINSKEDELNGILGSKTKDFLHLLD